MYKALEKTVHRQPRFKAVFTVQHLYDIIKRCELFPYSNVYKTIYLFAYFGFLRISNLVPLSKNTFSIKKHLCRGDIIVNPQDLIILIKWSKTLQASNQGSYIVLPRFKNSVLCPWQQFTILQKQHPIGKNSPCFCTTSHIVVESMLRSHLKTGRIFSNRMLLL